MVAQATLTKQSNALITMFLTLWTDKGLKGSPDMNRHRDKWGFQDMIRDLGYEHSQEVMEYYFRRTPSDYSVKGLLYSYDELSKRLVAQKKDAIERERIRKETAERVKKWEESVGN